MFDCMRYMFYNPQVTLINPLSTTQIVGAAIEKAAARRLEAEKLSANAAEFSATINNLSATGGDINKAILLHNEQTSTGIYDIFSRALLLTCLIFSRTLLLTCLIFFNFSE